MSLDVTLYSDNTKEMPEWQKNKDASLAEAGTMVGLIPMIEKYYNDRMPKREMLYDSNITHNLGIMADDAGIYKHLWRPEELGITIAKDLIEPLQTGLDRLKGAPEHYKKFNAENGWGKYENLVSFVEGYLNTCEEFPDAVISVDK